METHSPDCRKKEDYNRLDVKMHQNRSSSYSFNTNLYFQVATHCLKRKFQDSSIQEISGGVHFD